MKTFGSALKQERKKQRVTLRKLSEHVGLSVGYLSDIEQGRRRAPADLSIINAMEEILSTEKGVLQELAKKVESVSPKFVSNKIQATPRLCEILLRADSDLTPEEFHELMEQLENMKNRRTM